MEVSTQFFLLKGFGAIALIAVGFMALRYGVQLFREGTGLKREKTNSLMEPKLS